MVILKELFGKLLGDSSKIIDEVVTSQEEKMVLKNELEKILNENRVVIEQEVTKRWEADMNSDSWLAKNIRPLSLGFLLVVLTVFTLIDFGFVNLHIKDSWINLWQVLAITAFGAYFGSRGLEKIKNGK
jgi:hypothetical protein